MRRSLQGAIVLSAAILFLALASSFGWGETADRLVTNRAVDTLPQEMQPFFYANRQFLVEHVGAAEESDPKTGTPRHTDFIQLDHYGQFPFSALPRDYNAAILKYNRRTLEQYGILPWEIGSYSKKLTDAFRERDWSQVRLSAATLAHYVNAAHDPFNTTINMDGKLSAQPGVNERFSIGLVDRYQLFSSCNPTKRFSFTIPLITRSNSASPLTPGSKLFYWPIVALTKGFPATRKTITISSIPWRVRSWSASFRMLPPTSVHTG